MQIGLTFLCLWFVVSQSVMPVELFVHLAEQNALRERGFDKNNNMPALLAFFVILL